MRSIYHFILFFLVLMVHNSLVFSQQVLEEKISQFNTYYAENYQELIYIHVDKNYYLAGEQIRFKVYCMDKTTSRLSALSKVAYVELLDRDNVPRIQAKIELKNGTGHGEAFIPTGISSGNFILRGYTRWMRNYGPESFFHSALVIVNPFKRLGLNPLADKKDVSINFYPEGKVLIEGRKSKVVYDCLDENGQPCAAIGKLITNDTVVVEEFKTAEWGIGSFEFEPAAGQNYHVELQHEDGTTTEHAFSPIENKGLAFQLKRMNSSFSLDIFSR